MAKGMEALACIVINALLTRKQWDALQAAATHGYFKIPRAVNLVELAAIIGSSPAALSELLRRAEEKVMMAFVEGRLALVAPGHKDRGSVEPSRPSDPQ